jgi:hypothetical protein
MKCLEFVGDFMAALQQTLLLFASRKMDRKFSLSSHRKTIQVI